jgi:hypothetical protein
MGSSSFITITSLLIVVYQMWNIYVSLNGDLRTLENIIKSKHFELHDTMIACLNTQTETLETLKNFRLEMQRIYNYTDTRLLDENLK